VFMNELNQEKVCIFGGRCHFDTTDRAKWSNTVKSSCERKKNEITERRRSHKMRTKDVHRIEAILTINQHHKILQQRIGWFWLVGWFGGNWFNAVVDGDGRVDEGEWWVGTLWLWLAGDGIMYDS
jgi:hypothetical protein